MATMKPQGPRAVIPARAWKGSQSWEYESTWEVRGTVVRVTIDRDSYDFQSSLQVHAFDPAARQWNPLLRRPIAGTASEAASYVQRDAPLEAFRKDEAVLLAEAEAILAAAGGAR